MIAVMRRGLLIERHSLRLYKINDVSLTTPFPCQTMAQTGPEVMCTQSDQKRTVQFTSVCMCDHKILIETAIKLNE